MNCLSVTATSKHIRLHRDKVAFRVKYQLQLQCLFLVVSTPKDGKIKEMRKCKDLKGIWNSFFIYCFIIRYKIASDGGGFVF